MLRIDTYGGLVDSGLKISRLIKTSDIPFTAFVDEKAISAGSMIALACDEIVMEPGALLGDCGVISMSEMGDVERAKAEVDRARGIRRFRGAQRLRPAADAVLRRGGPDRVLDREHGNRRTGNSSTPSGGRRC